MAQLVPVLVLGAEADRLVVAALRAGPQPVSAAVSLLTMVAVVATLHPVLVSALEVSVLPLGWARAPERPDGLFTTTDRPRP